MDLKDGDTPQRDVTFQSSIMCVCMYDVCNGVNSVNRGSGAKPHLNYLQLLQPVLLFNPEVSLISAGHLFSTRTAPRIRIGTRQTTPPSATTDIPFYSLLHRNSVDFSRISRASPGFFSAAHQRNSMSAPVSPEPSLAWPLLTPAPLACLPANLHQFPSSRLLSPARLDYINTDGDTRSATATRIHRYGSRLQRAFSYSVPTPAKLPRSRAQSLLCMKRRSGLMSNNF